MTQENPDSLVLEMRSESQRETPQANLTNPTTEASVTIIPPRRMRDTYENIHRQSRPPNTLMGYVPGYCEHGREERVCDRCRQIVPADDLTAAAFRWFAEGISECSIDQVPMTTVAIVNEYRYSSRCEHDHPDQFQRVNKGA